ncbi:hypothetical protein J2X69_001678 [Algoriphagus sp. 4150]|nr:hypothetical protein [Algoriphagus sp. 4150]
MNWGFRMPMREAEMGIKMYLEIGFRLLAYGKLGAKSNELGLLPYRKQVDGNSSRLRPLRTPLCPPWLKTFHIN